MIRRLPYRESLLPGEAPEALDIEVLKDENSDSDGTQKNGRHRGYEDTHESLSYPSQQWVSKENARKSPPLFGYYIGELNTSLRSPSGDHTI